MGIKKEGKDYKDMTNSKVTFLNWDYIEAGYGIRRRKNPKTGETYHVSVSLPKNIELKVFAPESSDKPFFKPEKPWELGYLITYTTLFFDPEIKKYRLYYEALRKPKSKNDKWSDVDSLFCYAESEDCKNWIRPSLGLHEYEGAKDTNIMLVADQLYHNRGIHGSHIFYDPHAPKDERYKMTYDAEGNTVGIMISEDGIHWHFKDRELNEKPSILVPNAEADSQNVIYWDEFLQKYVGYFRIWRYGRRGIGRAETSDFWNWPEPEVLLLSDPTAEISDDYYTNAFHQIPGTERTHDAFIMFPAIYQRKDDTVSIELRISRDGKQWFKPKQKNLTPEYPKTENKKYSCYFGRGIYKDNDFGWNFVYSKYPFTHNGDKIDPPIGAFYWARWREDGIMALASKDDLEAEFWLGPFMSKNSKIQINALTGQEGYIKIGYKDIITDQEIPGYTIGDCDELKGDLRWKTITWNEESDISEFDDVIFKLHIVMKDTILYSIRFC